MNESPQSNEQLSVLKEIRDNSDQLKNEKL